MALTINTNIASIVAQKNLAKASEALNETISRMSTGYKINHSSDNAAGYSIARKWETQLSSLDVAADNAAMGSDMMQTLEDNYSLVTSHLQRIRDLTEQSANGTYGEASLKAIRMEMDARLDEIDRIAANCEYNGINLMNGDVTSAIKIQVGLYSDSNSDKSNTIELSSTLFADASADTIFHAADATMFADRDTMLTNMSGVTSGGTASGDPNAALDKIDKVLSAISTRTTTLGAAQNRIESAVESIAVQSQNITSSLSTLRDADISKESSNYIKAQILQQAASTLLSTANQTPSIALNLI